MIGDNNPATDPRIGSRIGDYLIEELLGVGGMGHVYRGQRSDGTSVALKLIKQDYARDETFTRRFRREARIAQTVHHPHVVPVLDTGEHEGLLFMAEMYIDGGSLEQKLKAGPLDMARTVEVCAQVAEGLEALWAAGMVHRDVKPANILLDQQGVVYITDFGLAKDSQGSVLTLPGQALGSMDYMAPEQIRGEQVTAATDIYALGCVVYECMCGRPPFADRQGMRVLWAHLQDEPSNLTTIRSEIPAEFARAVNQALAKDPAARPEHAGDYARMLAEAAAAGR
jgi:serine/threonine-protein kinase